MTLFRTTKRSIYSTLRAIGQEIFSQWPSRTTAHNDALILTERAVSREGEGGHEVTGRKRPEYFLFGR